MGKSKPKAKRYQCVLWLQSPAGKGSTPQVLATQINTALEKEGIVVHQHLDARFGSDTGDFYSQVVVEGVGINPARLQGVVAHLGQALMLLQAIKATPPDEAAAAPSDARPVIRIDERALKQR